MWEKKRGLLWLDCRKNKIPKSKPAIHTNTTTEELVVMATGRIVYFKVFLLYRGVGIVIRLWARQSGVGIPTGTFFVSAKTSSPALGLTQSPTPRVRELFCCRYSGRCVNLTSHLHLVSTLKMRGVIPLHPPHMPSWCGKGRICHSVP